MDRHLSERHERNFSDRRNQSNYKHALPFEHNMDRRSKKRFSSSDGDDESTFNQRKKNRYTMEAEHHSQRHAKMLASKTRPKQWGKPNYSKTTSKAHFNSSSTIPGFSDPEIAQPAWLNSDLESNPFFSYESGLPSVDSDGDVLMTDSDSEKVIIESSVLIELDSRLRNLEVAKKSWEMEVKEFKAKLSKNVCRLDALEDFAESRHRHSRQRQVEGWWTER